MSCSAGHSDLRYRSVASVVYVCVMSKQCCSVWRRALHGCTYVGEEEASIQARHPRLKRGWLLHKPTVRPGKTSRHAVATITSLQQAGRRDRSWCLGLNGQHCWLCRQRTGPRIGRLWTVSTGRAQGACGYSGAPLPPVLSRVLLASLRGHGLLLVWSTI